MVERRYHMRSLSNSKTYQCREIWNIYQSEKLTNAERFNLLMPRDLKKSIDAKTHAWIQTDISITRPEKLRVSSLESQRRYSGRGTKKKLINAERSEKLINAVRSEKLINAKRFEKLINAERSEKIWTAERRQVHLSKNVIDIYPKTATNNK